jgi:hypothetical protein
VSMAAARGREMVAAVVPDSAGWRKKKRVAGPAKPKRSTEPNTVLRK